MLTNNKMPTAGDNATTGNFIGLKAENCSIIKLRGLKVLEDDQGHDLLKILRKGGAGGSSELEVVVTNLLQRIDTVEKYLQNMPPPTGAKGAKGDQGDQGDQGEPGPQGSAGPRGKDGAKTLAALADVNLDGLDEGGMLAWSKKDKKWVVKFLEEEEEEEE
jgi:hypothetical protein